ncbi:MAG TPA: efflux RND transporter periplasmic adaptor subunit [Puia sp.]|nr:efflux RND transporter periplasmic adaptor subunit [Puia sp.]
MRAILFLILPALFFASCNNQQPQQTTSLTATRTDSVKVFILKAAKLEKQTTLPGELIPYEQAEIHSKVAGYIRQMKCDIGSVVKKGQVLAIISAPEIESGLEAAAGKTQAAKAKYDASKDTYNRVLEASQSDGVIAPNELQRARSQMSADSADYIASIYSSKSSKQIGNYLVIIAPFSGVITERNVQEGAFVGTPNEKPIVKIEDNSRLRLQVSVPEALTGVQLKDNKIHFSTKADPNQLSEGTLVRKSGSIDAGTRTEIWEFEIKNDHNTLKPGAFADVKLDVFRNQPTLIVPFAAIVTTLEKKFVIRVNHGITEWVDVSQGLNLTDKTEIFGKLHDGDTLVARGNEELRPGTKIGTKF